MIKLFATLLLGLSFGLTGCALPQKQGIALPVGGGVTQTIYLHPASHPFASAVFFPGASGVVAAVQGNFLLRVADEFAAKGITVAVADSPSDHPGGMSHDFRASASAASDVAAIVAFLRHQPGVPVWLVGTSNGTISAANAAVRIGPPQVAGLVLTSSVWSGGMAAVPLGRLRVPTLIVHNRNDGCAASPFSQVAPALEEMTAAPVKQLIAVSSSSEISTPCNAFSPHGYLGIESAVVSAIVDWIRTHTR
jgi:dienelactone hydrolase